MGQKVDPRGLRLGITRTWESIWYADKKEYAKFFHEDIKIREMIKKKLLPRGNFEGKNRENFSITRCSFNIHS